MGRCIKHYLSQTHARLTTCPRLVLANDRVRVSATSSSSLAADRSESAPAFSDSRCQMRRSSSRGSARTSLLLMRLNSAARIRGERGEVRTRAVAPLRPGPSL